MGKYSDRGLVAYAEYGLREKLTLVASVPYKRLEDVRRFAIGTGKQTNNGFGDFELRLRWRLRERPFVLSAAAGGRVPMGYDVEATRIPLGTAEMAADARLLLGRSLYPFPGYVTGEAGYRVRRGPFGDELLFAVEAGAAAGRLLVKLNISGVRSVSTCGDSGVAGLVGDQDILNVSPGVIYRLSANRELNADFNHIAAGCNSSAGSGVSLGIAFHR